MPPSADAFPGRVDRNEPPSAPPARLVSPSRSAAEADSDPGETPFAPGDGEGVPPETDQVRGDVSRQAEADPPAPDAEAGKVPGGLTERERRILAFERNWWRHAGAKEQAIRDTFGLSATRYYQLLNALLDNPAALAVEPLLVGRLRRLRSSRARNRRR